MSKPPPRPVYRPDTWWTDVRGHAGHFPGSRRLPGGRCQHALEGDIRGARAVRVCANGERGCIVDARGVPAVRGEPDDRVPVAGAVERFRRLVAEYGRDPDQVPISLLLFSRPTPARLERYAALGIERVVASAPTAELVDADFILRDIEAITPVLQQHLQS